MIGNVFHSLRNEQEAKRALEAALADSPELAAQVHKNLGSNYALLGDHEHAVDLRTISFSSQTRRALMQRLTPLCARPTPLRENAP